MMMNPYRIGQFFLGFFLAIFLFIGCSHAAVDSVKNLRLGAGEQIIVLGDSIASGYGVASEDAFPNILSRKLNLPIVNRGVGGDTTTSALRRLDTDVLQASPWLVIVELGGNDFLRKMPKSETEKNLKQIITLVQQKNAIAVLLGMNLGYFKDEYKELYERVAQETQAYLIPQVLRDILDNPKHRQQDIIHPNVVGHDILAERVAKGLKPLLEKAVFPATLKQ